MRASRLVSLLLVLQTRGQLTAVELAERLGVSERTVQRDAQALGRPASRSSRSGDRQAVTVWSAAIGRS
jgi:predicted DNA-binding transcriptional regulator YafY